MAEQALLDRLKRYSKKCLTERTDGDFADAVWEAVEVIDGLLNDLQEALDTIEQNGKELKDCRNELCYKCGGYRSIEAFVCDGCRWKDGG